MKNNTLYCNTCEHKDICGTYCVKDYKPPCDSKSSFRGNQGQTIQIADLTRIADGLQVCCATCRRIYGECDFLNEALPDVCLDKMLCPEWQAREEKE